MDSRKALAILIGLLLVGIGPPHRSTAADDDVPVLLRTLRYDPESETAPLILSRLAGGGVRGWEALGGVVREYSEGIRPLAKRATFTLTSGVEAQRLEVAAATYGRVDDEGLRAILAQGLASAYPQHAELLHQRVRDAKPGAAALLLDLAERGLPDKELDAALDQPTLASTARTILDSRGRPPPAERLGGHARSVAAGGLAPAACRRFATAFAAAPDFQLLEALAGLLSDEDEPTRRGAHLLLLTVSGVTLAPEVGLWRSWIAGRKGKYVVPDPASPGAVRAAVVRAVEAVRQDLLEDGRALWADDGAGRGVVGSTALAVLSLLSAGVKRDDPAVEQALATSCLVVDRGGRVGLPVIDPAWETYSLAVLAMVLEKVEPKRHREALTAIRRRLVEGQLDNGQWTYASLPLAAPNRPPAGDNSNTQYANLGLRSLHRAGAEVSEDVWVRVGASWRGTVGDEGGWGYRSTGRDRTMSAIPMTAAGIAGVAIAAEGRYAGEAAERVRKDPVVARALRYLGGRLVTTDLRREQLYTFYAIERACALTGTLHFVIEGLDYDWYRAGARALIEMQKPDGTWGIDGPRHRRNNVGFGRGVDTPFGILFLQRATRTLAGTESQRRVEVEVTPEQAAAARARLQRPPPTPPTDTDAPPPPEEVMPVALQVESEVLSTRTGRVVIRGRVAGDWGRLEADGVPVEPAEDGSFALPIETAESRTVDLIAHMQDGTEVLERVRVLIDTQPPTLRMLDHPVRHVGKQRLRFEADEALDGVRMGSYYFPADGRQVLVTTELDGYSRSVAVEAVDVAGNKERQSFPVEVKERVLVLDGESAVRVDLREKPAVFTLECWAKAELPTRPMAILSDTERAGVAIHLLHRHQRHTCIHVFAGGKWQPIVSKRAWKPNRWTHLAVTYDGKTIAYWRDGKLQGTVEAAPYRPSNRALYVGADPDNRNRPRDILAGVVDEVRLSSVVRYTEAFRPAKNFFRDRHTVVLLHFDTDTETAFLDDSGRQHNGRPTGKPQVAPAAR